MTRVFLIRHAQAEGNLYRRIQGRYDGRITKLGRLQIELLRARLLPEKIDAVYSSDLRRAMETAEAAAEPRGLEIKKMPGLREIALGVWEDRCWGELEDDDPEQIYLYNASPDRWSIPGGEPYYHVQARFAASIRVAAAENDGGSIAVFSHGGAIRDFLAFALGVPANEIKRVNHCDNTAITLLEVTPDEFKVVYLNNNDHLPVEASTFKRETWWMEESSNDGRNMRFYDFDVRAREKEYLAAYRDAWTVAHGNDEGFSKIYARSARRRADADPAALAEAVLLGKSAGLIELAPESHETPDGGHIAFLYLKPEFRRRALGPELIGYAVSYYRKLGRKELTLRVASSNVRAVDFYRELGFEYADLPGSPEPRLMRMDIS